MAEYDDASWTQLGIFLGILVTLRFVSRRSAGLFVAISLYFQISEAIDSDTRFPVPCVSQ